MHAVLVSSDGIPISKQSTCSQYEAKDQILFLYLGDGRRVTLETVCFKSCKVGLGDGRREATAMARQRVLISSRWNSMWEVNWRANSGVLWRLKRTVDIRDGSRFGDICFDEISLRRAD